MCGHEIPTDENLLIKVNLNIEVELKEPKGRSKRQWLDILDGDLRVSWRDED